MSVKHECARLSDDNTRYLALMLESDGWCLKGKDGTLVIVDFCPFCGVDLRKIVVGQDAKV